MVHIDNLEEKKKIIQLLTISMCSAPMTPSKNFILTQWYKRWGDFSRGKTILRLYKGHLVKTKGQAKLEGDNCTFEYPELDVILQDAVAKRPKIEPMIDGYSGFLFLDKNDMPMVALHWEKYFHHIREKYNSIYKVQMSCITPHVCRHTFCSNMAKSGMNPKTLQYIMGHSDIGVTLNTYAHLQFEDALVEMKKVVG